MDTALDRDTIDGALLCDVVGQALGHARIELGEWDCRPLAYDVKNVGSLGVYRLNGVARGDGASRPWSVVLKIVRNPAGLEVAPGYVIPPDDFPSTHFSYWKREVLAYQSGVLADLPRGVAAPRCFAVVETRPQVFWLWLEDLADTGDRDWPPARYRDTGRDLGRFNGAYLTGRPLPGHPWLQYGSLPSLVERFNQARAERSIPLAMWEHPLLRDAFPLSLLDRLIGLFDGAEPFLAALAQLPRTFCHRDAFPANLFTCQSPDGHARTVAIDWAFVGIGPIGEEIVPLITMCAAGPVSDPRPIEAVVLDGYLAGLAEAGWHGDPRLVRLGYAATAPLRYSLSTASILAITILQGDGVGLLEQRRGQPIARIVEQDAAFVTYLLDLADEARMLIADL